MVTIVYILLNQRLITRFAGLLSEPSTAGHLERRVTIEDLFHISGKTADFVSEDPDIEGREHSIHDIDRRLPNRWLPISRRAEYSIQV